MKFSTLRSEGSLISADLLDQIHSGEAPGQKSTDFRLNGKVRLIDEIAACWSDAKAYWEAFQHGLNRVKEGESGATQTREQLILPLLRTLGFEGITFSRSAAQVDGQTYAISHRLGDDEGLPIHIEGAKNDLDKRPPTGKPRISPHSLVQEYLNRTDHLWAIVTNGYQLGLLRDSERLSRPTYLEFDIKQIMEAELFSEFQVFYRIVHRSRWPKDTETAHECLLEQYYQQGIESGGRVREHLRDGVEQALKIFGNGFLLYPENHELRQNIKDGKLEASDYYRQLLRLVYRFLFLMVSEERNLVGPDPEKDLLRKIYDQNYSISRLREKVERPVNMEEKFRDLWEGVKQAFRFYCYETFGTKLGIAPLNGDLFGPQAMPNLENAFLYNRDFLRGFAHLSIFIDNKTFRRINYAHLDVEELGSVYESLLEYHPIIKDIDGKLVFELAYGTERKSTGSYYTRPELVQELIKSALVPVIEDRLSNAKTKEEKEQVLHSLKVCDPAAGSGHFLLDAARRIGKELAKVRTGEEEPTPSEFRIAVRDVIQHCIYGVDLNPLAVDLCKVALWIEGHNRGYPLTFLDHRIKCGNSLIGVDKLERLKDGIPDDAFKPVTGDDKEVAKKIKARNRQERKDWEKGIMRLPFDMEDKLESDLRSFAEQAQSIDAISEKSPEDVNKKQEQYEKIRTDEAWYRDWIAANIWTSAFFYPLTEEKDPAIPTHDSLMRFIEHPKAAHGQLIGKANAMFVQHRFFHWPLEFPEIAKNGGFDVILGNPPWERIKLQEQEFFAARDPEIANAPNKAARAKLIKKLQENNPALYKEFENAKHDAESASRFVRSSNRFPLTSIGDVNTYALFAELSRIILSPKGRAGIIVPIGIATDDTTKYFFSKIVENKNLAKLIGYENEAFIFPSVHHSFKFCTITTTGEKIKIQKANFAFFLRHFNDIDEEERHFELSDEILSLINPNTKTTPIFRTKVDAELTKKIYLKVPVLKNEKKDDNPWGVSFLSMFHMSNDSHFFHNDPGNSRLPLYEAKMIWQFDHRFGTYDGQTQSQANQGKLPELSKEQHNDPKYFVLPRYWVDKNEVKKRIPYHWEKEWFVGFRDVTSSVVLRTAIFSIIPFTGVGGKLPIIIFSGLKNNKEILCFLANVNSLVFDFIVRQKVGGVSLSLFIVKQLPILTPNDYSQTNVDYIASRVLELVYTSMDLKSFANDMGYDGIPFQWNEERRAMLRAELDAYYAKLYGLSRDELCYILDPHDVYGPNFPGETFRVLKEKEIKQYGEYRTRRLIIEAWDRLIWEK